MNPFIDRIPVEDKAAYLDDVVQRLIRKFKTPVEVNQDNKQNTIAIPYKNIVAYARKRI